MCKIYILFNILHQCVGNNIDLQDPKCMANLLCCYVIFEQSKKYSPLHRLCAAHSKSVTINDHL